MPLASVVYWFFLGPGVILGVPTNVLVMWQQLNGAPGTIAMEFFTLNLAVAEVISNHLSLLALQRNVVSHPDHLDVITTRPTFQSCVPFAFSLADWLLQEKG